MSEDFFLSPDDEDRQPLLSLFEDIPPPSRRPSRPPGAGEPLFRDHWAYLTEWFAFSAEIERGVRRSNPEDEPLRRYPALVRRGRATLAAGIPLPVESCVDNLDLDQVDRLLLVALLREALCPASEGGVLYRRLLGAAGAFNLEMCQAVRRRLEVESPLRSSGILECNRDPAPARRVYRLAPRCVAPLVNGSHLPAIPGKTDAEAVEFLSRHARELVRGITGDSERGSPWRAAPESGPGWSETRSAAESLLRVVQSLAAGGRGAVSEMLRQLACAPAQQALLSLAVMDARYRLGSVPAGVALSFVSALVRDPQSPEGLFGKGSGLVRDGLVEVLPGRSLFDGTLRLSDDAEGKLLPGTAAGKSRTERPDEGDQRPFDRVEPKTKLDDVVLSESLRKELDDALAQLRSRELLFGPWGFTSPSYAGNGAVLLFEGPPGTGKSYAAEALAGELGRPLYRVRFDQLHNRWFGETEKMIAAAFRSAERENAVLLIDEADAVLGARDAASQSFEVRHINCLLQEIERFPGIAVFTTNRPAALDPALERRLAARLHFPLPGLVERVALWMAHLPGKTPKAKDVNLVALSKAFPLSGSQIRTSALRAAAAAAQREGKDRVIRQADLSEAAGRVGNKEQSRPVGFGG